MEPEIGKCYESAREQGYLFIPYEIDGGIAEGLMIYVDPKTLTFDDGKLYTNLFGKAVVEAGSEKMRIVFRSILGNIKEVKMRNRKWGKELH